MKILRILAHLSFILTLISCKPSDAGLGEKLTAFPIGTEQRWSYEPTGQTIPIPIIPGVALVDQLSSSSPCCSGTYHVHIVLPENWRTENLDDSVALYIPAIGGRPNVFINGQLIPLVDRDYSSVGPIVLISRVLLEKGQFDLDIEVSGPRTNLSGLWKGIPTIGPFQELLSIRDSDRLFQQVLPGVDALILGLFAGVFLLIHYSLNKRRSLYLVFSWVLSSWAFFYLFLSGYPRAFNFYWGTSLHYPVRIVASFGLFAMIAGHARLAYQQVKIFGFLFLTIASMNLALGLAGLPVHQIGVLAFVGLLSFYPLILFRWYSASYLRRIAFCFSLVALMGQTSDAFKLLEGVFHLYYPVPFLNRYTFLPLLLLSFGDCLVQFTGTYHGLRVHFFRAKQHARNSTKLSNQNISERSLGALIKNPRKLTRVHRASILKRGETGAYKVIEVDGVSREAIGSRVNLVDQPHISQAVRNGSVVVTDLPKITDAKWKTTRCAAIPIPQIENPPYILLLSDPRSESLLTADDIPYLSQFSSALWANLERSRELNLRIEAERKFAKLVKVMDPNLFDFVTRNIDSIGEAEIKISTDRGIIFFDQKSYSTMMEELTDQEAAIFSIEVNNWVTQVAARHGAMVTNFAGDAYLIEVFSLASESSAAIGTRALELVWDLANSLVPLNQRLLGQGFDPITFRFGAHFGSVAGIALDFIRPGLRNIVGDNVNIAARLQSLAGPGRILVSEDLQRLVGDHFLFRKVPRGYVKGRQKSVEIYEVIARQLNASQVAS